MDCEEKFIETCLPPIEKFYTSLTDKNITKEEYENSQKSGKCLIYKIFVNSLVYIIISMFY